MVCGTIRFLVVVPMGLGPLTQASSAGGSSRSMAGPRPPCGLTTGADPPALGPDPSTPEHPGGRRPTAEQGHEFVAGLRSGIGEVPGTGEGSAGVEGP